MKRRRESVYHFICTIPDRVYPFQTEVHGHFVRGMRAYDAVVARHIRRYGAGHYGFGVDAYRQIFHLAGSILFLISAAYVSQSFFRNEEALYVFTLAAALFITYQEFYLHRKIYRQLWRKGVVDWLAWCGPMAAYVFFILK